MHKMPPLAEVSSRFGAPMGRRDTHADDQDSPRLFLLVRLPWVDGDYDPGGAYWGSTRGTHIYRALSEHGEAELFVRAVSLHEAEGYIREGYPNASFTFASDIDAFVQAYIEAALWSSMDWADEAGGEPLDANYGSEDLDPETLARIREDCADFYAANEQDLAEWGDDSQAGHDFWLTRNHHGAGFWDRGRGALGQRLTKASQVYGSIELYVDDTQHVRC